MDPKKKNPQTRPEIDVTRSATVRYFSVYPRKRADTRGGQERVAPATADALTLPHSSNQQPATTANQLSVPSERYTSVPHEFGPTLNRSDAGHTNYAWVD